MVRTDAIEPRLPFVAADWNVAVGCKQTFGVAPEGRLLILTSGW
jgi:hypothetical protein